MDDSPVCSCGRRVSALSVFMYTKNTDYLLKYLVMWYTNCVVKEASDLLYNNIDIKENRLVQFDRTLLEILLKDRTTGKNIIWATDNYAHYG